MNPQNPQNQLNFFTSGRLGFKIIRILIILSLAVVLIQEAGAGVEMGQADFQEPLLLESGLATVNEAEVTIVIWLESPELDNGILTALPQAGWQWESMTYESGWQHAISISGTKITTSEEESTIRDWYLTLAHQVAEVGGIVYFDERVAESLDIAAYLASRQAVPQQWTYLASTRSIAGYQAGLNNPVIAGLDQVNIQLLTRGTGDQGQTVLAIPVLLQEF